MQVLKRDRLQTTSQMRWIPGLFQLLFCLHLILQSLSAQAAPCCAGTIAAPTLISNDDRTQVTFSYARAVLVGDATNYGKYYFRPSDSRETTSVFQISASSLIADLWQIGISTSLVQKSVPYSPNGITESSGVGDTRLGLAYEILPEITYSPLKPRGYIFFLANLPTGISIYDNTSALLSDATGTGFWTTGLGALFIKRWSKWDAFVLPEFHYAWPRTFADVQSETLEVSPGFGSSTTIGGGFNFSTFPLRVGLHLMPAYQQPKKIVSQTLNTTINTSYQLVWNSGLELSWLFTDEWSLSGNYEDQTLLGPAVNSSLSRTVTVTLARKWQR